MRSFRFFVLFGTFLFVTSRAASAGAPRIEAGKQVSLVYQLFVEGELLESAERASPFTYTHGANQIVPGLEKALEGLRVGDKRKVEVTPEEAYGPVDPKALQEIPKDKIPPDVLSEKGALVEARNAQGHRALVKIVEVKEKSLVIDFNHPLAGKRLEFQVEVLKIQ